MEIKDIISSGLLEMYVTGTAGNEEVLQVQEWMEQYPEVREEVEKLEEAMESYILSEAIQPDNSIKEKIFSRIQTTEKQEPFSVIRNNEKRNNERETKKAYAIPAYYKWAIAASIVLLIGSLIFNYTFYNKYQSTTKALQTAQTELQKQEQLAQAMKTDMDVVTDKNAMPVVLNGTEKAPEAVAKIFWMKNTGDVYVDPTNLPKAPSGMQYQLWAIVDGKPVDAGMISTEKGIYHIQKMKTFGKAQAFAITLETAGGNPTPKGEMIVQAKI